MASDDDKAKLLDVTGDLDVKAPTDVDAEPDVDKFILNLATQFVHRAFGEGLACGKALPDKHAVVHDLPKGSRKCAKCF